MEMLHFKEGQSISHHVFTLLQHEVSATQEFDKAD